MKQTVLRVVVTGCVVFGLVWAAGRLIRAAEPPVQYSETVSGTETVMKLLPDLPEADFSESGVLREPAAASAAGNPSPAEPAGPEAPVLASVGDLLTAAAAAPAETSAAAVRAPTGSAADVTPRPVVQTATDAAPTESPATPATAPAPTAPGAAAAATTPATMPSAAGAIPSAAAAVTPATPATAQAAPLPAPGTAEPAPAVLSVDTVRISAPGGRQIGQPIQFAASVRHARGSVQYTYTLIRANGNRMHLSDASVFSWTFITPSVYRIEVSVRDASGQTARFTQPFTVADAPIQISGVVMSRDPVRTYEPVSVRTDVSGGVGGYTYDYTLYRSDGRSLKLSDQAAFDWTFWTPGSYRLAVAVSDGFGHRAVYEHAFRVAPNRPVIEGLEPAGGGKTYTELSVGARATGGVGDLTHRYTLLRPDGTAVGTFSGQSFKWTFFTPATYTVRATVRDARGQQVTGAFPLKVTPAPVRATIDIRPGNPAKVYETVHFSADSEGLYGDVRYQFTGYRSNNTPIHFADARTFDWTFLTPDTYRIVVRATDSLKRVATATQTLEMLPNPLTVGATRVVNDSTPAVYEDLTFRTEVEGGLGAKTYRYQLKRSDGRLLDLAANTAGRFDWRFLTPGRYTLLTAVTDQLGQTAVRQDPLIIAANRPVIEAIVLPFVPTQTDIETVFTARIEGGGRLKERRLELVRANGVVVVMAVNESRVNWTVTTPGRYRYRVSVRDEGGGIYRADVPMQLAKAAGKPRIEGVQLSKSNLTETLDDAQRIRVAASAPDRKPLRYEYWVSVDGRPASRLAVPDSREVQTRLSRIGSYELFTVVRSSAGAYAVQQSRFHVRPNVPVVTRLAVDTSKFESGRTLQLDAGVRSGTGHGVLRYQYVAYSWRNGRTVLGTYTAPRQTVRVTDPDVAAIQLIVTDEQGYQAVHNYRSFALPGGWRGHRPAVSRSASGRSVTLSWDSVQHPTGFAVFRDGRLVGDTAQHTFVDADLVFGPSYRYQIVPYISFTGSGYEQTERYYRMAKFDAYESLSVNLRPSTLEEILATYTGRDLVAAIARHAENRIPYYLGGKAVGPGYEVNAFDSDVPPDEAGSTKRGLNCSGFVQWVFWTAGYGYLDTGTWVWTATIMDNSPRISESELLPGDLGFTEYSGSWSNHVGIYLGDGEWAHLPTVGYRVLVDRASYWQYFHRPRMWA